MLDQYYGKRICVLDGGLATELERKGFSFLVSLLFVFCNSVRKVTDKQKINVGSRKK